MEDKSPTQFLLSTHTVRINESRTFVVWITISDSCGWSSKSTIETTTLNGCMYHLNKILIILCSVSMTCSNVLVQEWSSIYLVGRCVLCRDGSDEEWVSTWVGLLLLSCPAVRILGTCSFSSTFAALQWRRFQLINVKPRSTSLRNVWEDTECFCCIYTLSRYLWLGQNTGEIKSVWEDKIKSMIKSIEKQQKKIRMLRVGKLGSLA